MNTILSLLKSSIAVVLIAALLLVQTPTKAFAAAADFQKAQISFTFDDGFESVYTNALPILAARGITATAYIPTGIIDKTVQGGLTDDGNPAMTWDQVLTLQNTYGWDIGSHTVSHNPLTPLTAAQVQTELQQSQAKLLAKGLSPVSMFAFPEGDYNNSVLTESIKDYAASRGFQDVGLNTFPYNKAVILDESLDKFMTIAQAEAFVDQAIANKQWLVFSGHSIQPASNPNYDYVWTIADFTALADYIKSKSVPVVKIADAVKDPGSNLTTNSSFEQGLTTGWTNDNSAQVTLDTNRNGSYPSPTNSVKMTGSATSNHLFSTLINAIPGADYLVQAFANTIGLTTGEFGFYMDEYDTNNNWISGQWLGLVANNTVGFFSKVYHATSDLVAKLRVQTYLTAGATGSIYTDNVNLFNLSATGTPSVTPTGTPTVTPSVTPTATPSGTPTNLITNGDFDNGLANGWTTDNATQVKADTNNHGTTPSAQTSIAMTGSAASSQLFFGLLPIDPTANYLLQAFVDAKGITAGELGFYMDEYDAAGNWLSGQWLGAVVNGAVTNFSKAYKATSTLVNQIRVQTYIFKGTTGTAYVDNYQLTNQSAPTNTPTPTVSITPSGTPTVTPTITPTVTPTVTPTPGVNLVANNSFETLTSSWANNWINDSTNFTIDTTSKGDNGTNSLHLTPNTAYAHTFSDQIAVDAASTYHWTQFITTLAAGGEFGFYIDEYDATGTWISGQWKGMINALFTGIKDFTYVPSSTNVKTVRLQYYAIPSSTFDLYLDSVTLSK